MMDEYFSTLFYDDPADVFGIDSALNNNEKPKSENSTDHTQFYNNHNLEADCNERLLEKNADIDKLIAKFDNHIENIWKTSANPDSLQNIKRQAICSQNPGLQNGSNLFWPREQNKFGEGNSTIKVENENGFSNCKSSFSHWNKYSSPLLNSSNGGFDALLSTFNFTFSNVQKWSAVDSRNNLSNLFSNYNKCESNSTEIPRKIISFPQSDDKNLVFEIGQNFQEEEDLLISAKTHFRPIKTDELVGSQTKLYADGTTFAISNELEKVSFKRSESGTLYLDTDTATPRKYMEFKEKEIFETKGDWESDFSSVEEFIPKFRVRQSNEKSVQTDEIDEERKVPSTCETDCESVSLDSQEDEFYFPGDDELAQNIINTIEAESTLKNEILNSDHGNCKRNTLEMSSYVMPKYVHCICSDGNIWNRSLNKDACYKQEWSKIWNSKITCDSCQINGDRLSTKDKFKFREELTLEGEQLLLDLSCLQQMYSSSDWCNCDSVSVSDSNEQKEEMDDRNEEIRTDKFNKFDLEYPKKDDWWTQLIAKEEPIKKGFDLRCLWKEKFLLQISKENEKNERPFIANFAQDERKRRNSSNQRTCTVYLEGQPYCNFSHYDSPFPWPLFVEPSCKKGESCLLSHTLRRPLSM